MKGKTSQSNLQAPKAGKPRAPIYYNGARNDPFREEDGPTIPAVNKTFESWPPNHHDVLLGSPGAHHHEGNRAFLDRIHAVMKHYSRLTRREQSQYKTAFTKDLPEHVRFRRIVWQLIERENGRRWEAVGTIMCPKQEMRRKVSQTFLDATIRPMSPSLPLPQDIPPLIHENMLPAPFDAPDPLPNIELCTIIDTAMFKNKFLDFGDVLKNTKINANIFDPDFVELPSPPASSQPFVCVKDNLGIADLTDEGFDIDLDLCLAELQESDVEGLDWGGPAS